MRRVSILFIAVLSLALAPRAEMRADAPKKPEGGVPAPPASLASSQGVNTGAGLGRIAIEKPLFDAGDVVRGKPASAVFEIKNTGTDVLKILSARPG